MLATSLKGIYDTKKLILFSTAPLALIAGCSYETQIDTTADDTIATTSEMPADTAMGTTGDAAGTMQSGDTGATGTGGPTGMDRSTGTTGSGTTTGGTTPPQ